MIAVVLAALVGQVSYGDGAWKAEASNRALVVAIDCQAPSGPWVTATGMPEQFGGHRGIIVAVPSPSGLVEFARLPRTATKSEIERVIRSPYNPPIRPQTPASCRIEFRNGQWVRVCTP